MTHAVHHGDYAPHHGGWHIWGESLGRSARRISHRIIDAFRLSRHAQMDREIARLVMSSGGRLTDSLEREIMQKVLASHWSPPL